MLLRVRYSLVLRLVLALCITVVFATVVSACPNCKEALAANDPTHSGVVKGYFYSILFMMGTPFALVGGFSLYMYRQVQRARDQRGPKSSVADGDARALPQVDSGGART